MEINGAIFGVVKGENFVLCFLNKDVQPKGQISSYHVHQAKSCKKFVLVDSYLLKIKKKMNMAVKLLVGIYF